MKIQRDLNGLRTFLDADFTHLYGMLADQWSGRSDVDAYQVGQIWSFGLYYSSLI